MAKKKPAQPEPVAVEPDPIDVTEKIFPAAMAMLATYPGVTVNDPGGWERYEKFTVEVGGNLYTVTMDSTDVDFDDIPAEPKKMAGVKRYKKPKKVEDHSDILCVCQHVMAADPAVRETISDMTTDGDHKDCETIFCYTPPPLAGEYFRLKVR